MAIYPNAVATTADLLAAKNNATGALAINLDAVGTTIVTTSITFPEYSAVVIDGEIIILGNLVLGAYMNCVRGADGTAAAAHTQGSPMYGWIVAKHHNGLAAEVIAIETLLGPGGSNILGGVSDARNFQFTASAAVALSAGVPIAVTLSPMPAGIVPGGAGRHWVRIFDSVAGDESVLLTAISSTQITFTPALSHTSGNWRIESATGGIQEAYFGPARLVLIPPATYTCYAPLLLAGKGGSDFALMGFGTIASTIVRHSSYPAGDLVTASTAIEEGRITLSNFGIVNAAGFENTSGSGLNCQATQLDSVHARRVEVLNGFNPIKIGNTGRVILEECRAMVLTGYSTVYGCGDAIDCGGGCNHLLNCFGEIQIPTAAHGAGLKITGGDGLNVIGGNYMGRDCVRITADPSRVMNFIFLESCILDSAFRHGVYIETGSHNLVFSQIRIRGCSLATQGGDNAGCGVFAGNDVQSLVIADNNISGFRNTGIVLGAAAIVPKGFVISGNAINNNGTSGTGYGIAISQSADDVDGVITGNQIGNAIDAYGAPTQQVGIYFTGASNGWKRIVVSGNNVSGNTVVPIAFDAGPTNGVVWAGNSGVDDYVFTVVASAASIALPVYPVFGLTGTTGVGTITGPLCEGHEWTMVPTGVVTFTAGATIGNTFTTVANVPVRLLVYGGKVYLS